MKKILKLLIASILILPCVVWGGNVVVEDVSNITTQCIPDQSTTMWYYIPSGSSSISVHPIDNFGVNGADVYITVHDNERVGSSVQIWRHTYGNNKKVLANCTNWNRPSTVAPNGGTTVMALEGVGNCTLNKPTYTKTNNPGMVDAQIHFTLRYAVIWPYSSYIIPDNLYYTNQGLDTVTCFPSGTTKPNGSSCPGNAGDYTKHYTEQIHTGECLDYKVFWCGDGLVNSETGTTYSNNVTYVEECDPNAPGWSSQTCNVNTCKIIPQQPQCSTVYTGTHYTTGSSADWINSNTPGLCKSGTLVPNSFTVTWTPGNSRYFNWRCKMGQNEVSCQAKQRWCGDGKVTNGEACDPLDPDHVGWNNNGLMCNNSCQLVDDPNQQPQCSTVYTGTHYTTGSSADWINSNTPGLCKSGTLVPNSFTVTWTPGNSRYFNWRCKMGQNEVSCQAKQRWCGDGKVTNGEACDPNDSNHAGWGNGGCSDFCQPINGEPVPHILKKQKTGGMDNFTTNQLIVQTGEQITYRVYFGNSGTVAGTGEVRDYLPICVDYISSSIHLPAGTPYSGPITGHVSDQDYVKYKSFVLNPGEGGYMEILGYIRGTGMAGMIQCANVTSYTNTGYFKFVGGSTLSGSVVAVRPKLQINKKLLTTGNLTGGSIISYKITLKNQGSATFNNAYILDILPPAIQYLTSSIQNISTYLFAEGATGANEYYIKYYNFNLAPNQSAVVYLTGKIKNGFSYNETTNCAITNGNLIDCEEFPLTPVPFIQKYQKIGNDVNPNSNDWTTDTLTVELGQYISYRIDFGNLGNKAATGEVRDILPECVQYVSGHLVGANGNGPTYNSSTHIVQFTNIPLVAGQTAHMMVVGKIKQGDGCDSVYSYLNTGSFHFMNTPWQNSTVLAERPNTTDVEITKEVSPTGTVQQGDLVTYTINYRNKGPEVLQSYTILDYWPADKLNFSGVVYTNPNPSSYTRVGDNIIKRVFNTPLGVGQTGQIIIQGVVK